MAYTQKIIDEAFALYCLGYSFDKIVTEMKKTRKKSFKLTKKTVMEWAEKYGWKHRREEIQRQAGGKQNETIIETLNDSINRIDATIRLLSVEIPFSKRATISSVAGVMGRLIQLKTKLQGVSGGSKLSNAQIITTLFNVMEEDEELAELLERKEAWILERFEQMVEDES